MINSISFFTPISYQNVPNIGKMDRLLEWVDHYLALGNKKAVVLPGKLINGMQTVELEELPPKIQSMSATLLKIVKIVSFIPLGIPALIVKTILRSHRHYILNNPKPIKFYGKVTPDHFPFNIPCLLSLDQVAELKLFHWGEVDDPQFAGSRFTCEKADPDYIVVRHHYEENQSIALPSLDTPASLAFKRYAKGMDEALDSQKVAVYGINQIPGILAAGISGQVYETHLPTNQKAVFKVNYHFAGLKEGQRFLPIRLKKENSQLNYISTAEKIDSYRSFHAAFARATETMNFPTHPSIPKSYGVVYIKEYNLWAPVYERIEGDILPPSFDTIEKTRRVMKNLAASLKFLDENKSPYTDLHRGNVMLQPDSEIPVIIDDPVWKDLSLDGETSKQSRQHFGTLLLNILLGENSPMKNEDALVPSQEWINQHKEMISQSVGDQLASLIFDCCSDKSIQEMNWDHISQALA